MKLIEIIEHVRKLNDDAPFAVIGGLAQILWARKTHTDDLDVALTTAGLEEAYRRVCNRSMDPRWSLPAHPDLPHEANEVFEVYHLLFSGAVVDLIAFRDDTFNREILDTARLVPELKNAMFIRPELLLVTHLLRPGPEAALAAIELVIVRKSKGDLEEPYARKWATHMQRAERLERVLKQADALRLL